VLAKRASYCHATDLIADVVSMSCRAFRKLNESLAVVCWQLWALVLPRSRVSLSPPLCVSVRAPAQITSAEAGTAAAKFARRSTVARRVTTSERCH